MKTGPARFQLRTMRIALGMAAVVCSARLTSPAAESAAAPPEISNNASNTNPTVNSVTTNGAAAAAGTGLSATTNLAGTNAAASTAPVTAANIADILQPTRQMLESLQRDIESQVARHTAAITSTLMQIEPALDRIRQQQEQAAASANRTILIAAGLFAVAGFFGLGFLTMASVRAMGRFTDVAVNANRRQISGSSEVAPPASNAPAEGFKPVVSGTVEQASARFQGAIEQLERRILELEHSSHPVAAPISQRANNSVGAAAPAAATTGNGNIHSLPGRNEETSPVGTTTETMMGTAPANSAASRVEVHLGKGQSLLNLDQAAQALECFEIALTEEPNNTDALLRKGMALEKLQEWERALECYDRVIGLDESLTVAHLYRGGVCNRLERHREALESYEKALRSERQRNPVNPAVSP